MCEAMDEDFRLHAGHDLRAFQPREFACRYGDPHLVEGLAGLLVLTTSAEICVAARQFRRGPLIEGKDPHLGILARMELIPVMRQDVAPRISLSPAGTIDMSGPPRRSRRPRYASPRT